MVVTQLVCFQRERRALATGRVRWPEVELIVTRFGTLIWLGGIRILLCCPFRSFLKKVKYSLQREHWHARLLSRRQQAVAR